MKAPRVWVTMSTLLALPAAALISAQAAKADPVDRYTRIEGPVVCQALYAEPTLNTVTALFRAISRDTAFSIEEAAQVITSSVAVYCPDRQFILDRFVAVYAEPTPAYVAGSKVGGAIR